MFEINEKNSNTAFVVLYGLFLVSLLFGIYFDIAFFAILIFYFGSAGYGFISKTPIKSYLFGFLTYLTFVSVNIFEPFFFPFELDSSLLKYLIYALLWGLPGYFTAQKSTIKWKYVVFLLIALILILIEMLLFMRTW
jgi:hypothetical protein